MINGINQTQHAVNFDKKIIEVAVAILRYGDEFLLARRALHQHQGGKLEFVGGKIDAGESFFDAVIREVMEELGLSLKTDQLVFMGEIEHHYDDKSVRLHICQAMMNDEQYAAFANRQVGQEGQALLWLSKDTLLASQDALPEANAAILTWLADERTHA